MYWAKHNLLVIIGLSAGAWNAKPSMLFWHVLSSTASPHFSLKN